MCQKNWPLDIKCDKFIFIARLIRFVLYFVLIRIWIQVNISAKLEEIPSLCSQDNHVHKNGMQGWTGFTGQDALQEIMYGGGGTFF